SVRCSSRNGAWSRRIVDEHGRCLRSRSCCYGRSDEAGRKGRPARLYSGQDTEEALCLCLEPDRGCLSTRVSVQSLRAIRRLTWPILAGGEKAGRSQSLPQTQLCCRAPDG